MAKPDVTYLGLLDMQVCVPAEFSDAEVEAYANRANPTGTSAGWKIRKQGDKMLAGAPERCPCEERDGCVHLMLDC